MCGVFGIYDPPGDHDRDVARLTYFGLYALQHRGQESAGIAVSDGSQVMAMKDMGLVNQVFDEPRLSGLAGHIAIGHARYSTTGSTVWQNAQPIVRHAGGRTIALGHNGNLTNTAELRAELHERRVQLRVDLRHRGDRGAHRPAPVRRPGRRRRRHDARHRGRLRRGRPLGAARWPASAIPTGSARWSSAASTTRGCSRPRRAPST